MKPNHLLKHERELRGWSQVKVAEEIGTTSVNVSRWERGVSVPYPYFRERLCLLFGKDARTLGLVPEHDEIAGQTSGRHEQSFASSLPPTKLLDPTIPFPSRGEIKLIGRDTLLTQMKRALCRTEEPTQLALYGLPGVGKTALALALIADEEGQASFADGILWATVGPEPDLFAHVRCWGRLLGICEREMEPLDSLDAWAMKLRSTIGRRRMLLVIDDVWRIDDALALKVGGPHCTYLMTTRLPQVAVTFGMDGAGAIAVAELDEDDGLALLAAFAPELVKLHEAISRDLVRAVGSLPLALVLMGQYMQKLPSHTPVSQQHAALQRLYQAEERLQLCDQDGLVPRSPSLAVNTPLSLYTVIGSSVQQLEEHTRQALYSLAVLPVSPHTFSEEAALAVCQTPVEVLDTLSDAGLLKFSGLDRYALHPTIADYARMHLGNKAI